jgi:hypothetical protein
VWSEVHRLAEAIDRFVIDFERGHRQLQTAGVWAPIVNFTVLQDLPRSIMLGDHPGSKIDSKSSCNCI